MKPHPASLRKKITTIFLLSFFLINSFATNISAENEYEYEVITNSVENFFPDTIPGTLESEAATYLAQKGIIGGRPSGIFDGDASVNRAESAKFLLLSAEIDVTNFSDNGQFPDVKRGEWYVPYVMKAAEHDIIKGYPDGKFRPANTVNTVEFLKMLSETFELPSSQYSHTYNDVKTSDWFYGYAGIAQKFNLFPERDTNTLQPSRLLTRREVAIALYQYLKTSDTFGEFEYEILVRRTKTNKNSEEKIEYLDRDTFYEDQRTKNLESQEKFDETNSVSYADGKLGFQIQHYNALVKPEDNTIKFGKYIPMNGETVFSSPLNISVYTDRENAEKKLHHLYNWILENREYDSSDKWSEYTQIQEPIILQSGAKATLITVFSGAMDPVESVLIEKDETFFVLWNVLANRSAFRAFYRSFEFIN